MSNENQGESSKALVAAAALLVVLVGGWFFVVSPMLNTDTPVETDWNVQTSANGLYEVTATPSLDPIPLNETHDWTLHIETAAGVVVENAAIVVSGSMPAHGHGLPTQPEFAEYLGSGDYKIEGMHFQMPGEWEVDFVINDANSASDTVKFTFTTTE